MGETAKIPRRLAVLPDGLPAGSGKSNRRKQNCAAAEKTSAKDRLRRNSLTRFFYGKYLPAKAANWSPHTTRHHKRALAKFIQFLGTADASLRSIKERSIDQFREWMEAGGISGECARKYTSYVRAIIRAGNPRTFPERASGLLGDPGAKLNGPFDVAGSLFNFAVSTYLPEKMVGATPDSKKHVLMSIRHLCRFAGRNVMFEDLSDELVSGYMGHMLDQGYARPTVNNNRADILCVWPLPTRRALDGWPSVDKMQVFRRLPTAWTMEDMGLILAACAATKGMVGEIPACKFWTALVLVMFDSGIRLNTAFSVEVSNLDVRTGWLTVPAEVQKQKAEQRFLLSHQTTSALQILQDEWNRHRRLLFPFPWSEKQMWARLRDILHRAGLPLTRRDLYHKFRRTTASHIAAAAGIDAAARQLGHSGTTVTQRYIDPRIARANVDGAAPPAPAGRAPRALLKTEVPPPGRLCLPAPQR